MRVTRGSETESVHRADGVVVGLERGEELRFGDPERLAYWRSSMKPFQALPLVEDGVVAAFGLVPPDLALACGSHRGLPEHVARASAMLERIGATEADLSCGPHAPFAEEAARDLFRAGREPGRIHNNCSGKHAGMLALARHHGWPGAGYAEYGHPVQARIREALSPFVDVDPEMLSWAPDGCGVPTPYLSVRQMARAYARLGRAARKGEAAGRVVSAMTAHPRMVSGPGSLTTALMEATGGRLVAKEGAEGVLCVACPDEGWGAALKVADGAKRALGPGVLAVLGAAGLLRSAETELLREAARPEIRNTEGRVVGDLVAEAEPRRAAVAGRV